MAEPRFTARDRILLLASRRSDAVPHNSLGIRLDEAMDDANQFAWEGTGPRTDWSLKAVNARIQAYKQRYPDADLSALSFGVKLR